MLYKYKVKLEGFEPLSPFTEKQLIVKQRGDSISIELQGMDRPIVAFYDSGRVVLFKNAIEEAGLSAGII